PRLRLDRPVSEHAVAVSSPHHLDQRALLAGLVSEVPLLVRVRHDWSPHPAASHVTYAAPPSGTSTAKSVQSTPGSQLVPGAVHESEVPHSLMTTPSVAPVQG